VELNPEVAAWCRGPLALLTDGAVADPRVTVVVADVAAHLAAAKPGRYDAILFDLYEGPHAATQRRNDPLYGAEALKRARAALRPGGVFAVWSEEPDAPFERRLADAGFRVEKARAGRGGRAHVVYLGYTSR
jgi:spermidine synthase